MLIYLSGAITGIDKAVAERNFQEAEEMIKRRVKEAGIENVRIFNPLKDAVWGLEWRHYIKNDIKILCDADIVVLVDKNHEASKGVFLEKIVALALGIQVVPLEDFIASLIAKELGW